MRRRDLFALAGAFGAGLARAEGPYPGTPYRSYSACLPGYLQSLAHQAYRTRQDALRNVNTPETVRARAQWARRTFWNLIGGMPERTPLQARTAGAFERASYRVEKVVYQSRPEFHIPANLYIPKTGRPPYPGILFQMGHSLNGKAAGPYQKCCQGLVQLGYVVLAFDPMGQGERVYYPNAEGARMRLSSADDEHTTPGRQMLLLGDTSTRLQVWDAVRSLDYLASHPLVDAKRLGSTGNSGGGTLTMFLAAADDRLAAAVVCAGNTENFACANFNPPGSTDDAEQNFVYGGPAGFDRWDTLYPFAPKPLLIQVSDKDFFGTYSPSYISSGWEEFGILKRVYEVLGKGEQLAWSGSPLPHGLSHDSRLRVYTWFNRWLQGDSRPVQEEPPVQPEADETLLVTKSNSVVKEYGGQTPFTLNRTRTVKRTPAKLEDLLRLERPPEGRLAVLGRTTSVAVDVEAVEVQSAPYVWVPAWLFLPKKSDPAKPLVVAVENRNARWREDEFWQTLASRGYPVCLPDVRGSGDLTPRSMLGAAGYTRSHNDEEHWAWASLMLGRPLAGQRAADIVAVVRALRHHPPIAGRRLVLASGGRLAVPAIFAAALESSIDTLFLAGMPRSYREIVDSENYTDPFANFVPSILLHTDLPEILASIAPRNVIRGRDMAEIETALGA